jgi:uncharacterized membrane protein
VPENTLKFVVGILLTSFGIFWGAEGVAGGSAKWPGDNWAVPAIIACVWLFALLAIATLRRAGKSSNGKQAKVQSSTSAATKERSAVMKNLIAFVEFWVDFIVGDDWQIALGILIGFIITANIAVSNWTWSVIPIAVVLSLSNSLRRAR